VKKLSGKNPENRRPKGKWAEGECAIEEGERAFQKRPNLRMGRKCKKEIAEIDLNKSNTINTSVARRKGKGGRQ